MKDMNTLWEDLAPITDAEFQQRNEAVRRATDAAGLDAVIAYSNAKVVANVRYLTDYYTRFAGHQHTADGYYFFGATAALVPVEGEPMMRTDALWDVVRAGQLARYEDTGASTELGAIWAARSPNAACRRSASTTGTSSRPAISWLYRPPRRTPSSCRPT